MIIEIDCTVCEGALSDSVQEFLDQLEDVLKKSEESGVIQFYYMDVMSI
jgi:hypothetical protein